MSSIPLLVNQSKGYVETAKTEASFTVVGDQIWIYPRILIIIWEIAYLDAFSDHCLWAALPFCCFSCEEIIRIKYNPRCRIIKGLI